MDGLVTEYDVHAVVEIPEIVLGRGQLAAVVLWVVPASGGRERRTADQPRCGERAGGHSCECVGWKEGAPEEKKLFTSGRQ